jgi:hypothetical protein
MAIVAAINSFADYTGAQNILVTAHKLNNSSFFRFLK